MIRSISTVLAALAVAACVAPTSPGACHLAQITSIPMALLHDRLVLPVGINGQAVPLLLDTGSPVTMVSAAAAKLLGLSAATAPPAPIFTGDELGGARSFTIMRAQTVLLGTLLSVGMPIVVPITQRDFGAGDDANLVGMNLLGQSDIDIDLPGRRLNLFAPEGACTGAHVTLTGDLYPVRLIVYPRNAHILLPITVEGQAFVAALDTGARTSLIFAPAAARLGLTPARLSADPRISSSGLGPHRFDLITHRTGPITLGRLTVSGMRLNVVDHSSPDADIVLGMDFLEKVHVWIARSSGWVVFQAPPAASPTLNRPLSAA